MGLDSLLEKTRGDFTAARKIFNINLCDFCRVSVLDSMTDNEYIHDLCGSCTDKLKIFVTVLNSLPIMTLDISGME